MYWNALFHLLTEILGKRRKMRSRIKKKAKNEGEKEEEEEEDLTKNDHILTINLQLLCHWRRCVQCDPL